MRCPGQSWVICYPLLNRKLTIVTQRCPGQCSALTLYFDFDYGSCDKPYSFTLKLKYKFLSFDSKKIEFKQKIEKNNFNYLP